MKQKFKCENRKYKRSYFHLILFSILLFFINIVYAQFEPEIHYLTKDQFGNATCILTTNYACTDCIGRDIYKSFQVQCNGVRPCHTVYYTEHSCKGFQYSERTPTCNDNPCSQLEKLCSTIVSVYEKSPLSATITLSNSPSSSVSLQATVQTATISPTHPLSQTSTPSKSPSSPQTDSETVTISPTPSQYPTNSPTQSFSVIPSISPPNSVTTVLVTASSLVSSPRSFSYPTPSSTPSISQSSSKSKVDGLFIILLSIMAIALFGIFVVLLIIVCCILCRMRNFDRGFNFEEIEPDLE